MFKPDPVEAMARSLVAALLPMLEAAMLAGRLYREVVAEAVLTHTPTWRAVHGEVVAARAAAILAQIGPAAILTPYGRDVFLRDGPLVEIRKLAPVADNDNPPPPLSGIGRRIYRALVCFWGVPPASSA